MPGSLASVKLAIALTLLTGCYFHAVEKTSWTTEVETADVTGPAGTLRIALDVGPGQVTVRMARDRACVQRRATTGTAKIRKESELELLAPANPDDKDYLEGDAQLGRWLAMAVIVPAWPVFAAIFVGSAIWTKLEVEAAGTKLAEGAPQVDLLPYACDEPAAGVAIDVTLPSGRRVAGTTRADGTVVILAPDEPAGVVRVVVGGVTYREATRDQS